MKVFLSVLTLCAVVAANGVSAQPAPHRRALLIGINDYTASRISARPNAAPVPNRDWPNLAGAVNDVNTLREMLVLLYGFDRNDIVTMTDQSATREAIFQGLEHLVNTAAKDDVVFFYYAGHGSQVRNSLSEERDKLDESIVPADSRTGADDIRDKELRKYFNRILDRGARLTVMLDNCHSGSGARGLSTGGQARSVKRDFRDVADRTSSAKPEDHGALVLTASEDFDTAWETRDAEGKFHGEFSWAWMRAMRDAASGEPASETFLRAQAHMRAETPYQQPVMSGRADARMSPFLASRADLRGDHVVVAVRKSAERWNRHHPGRLGQRPIDRHGVARSHIVSATDRHSPSRHRRKRGADRAARRGASFRSASRSRSLGRAAGAAGSTSGLLGRRATRSRSLPSPAPWPAKRRIIASAGSRIRSTQRRLT